MTTILNVTIGESRSGVARVWMEGQKLVHAGIKIGTKYLVRGDEIQKRIELVPVDDGSVVDGLVTVSKRERNGLITPLLEIRTELLKSFYEGCERESQAQEGLRSLEGGFMMVSSPSQKLDARAVIKSMPRHDAYLS